MIDNPAPYRWTSFNGIRENLSFTWSWVKNFFQRGYRGWADGDIWSIDNYLSTIIPAMLREYKKTTIGYPGEFCEGAETFEAWKERINEMIEAFDASQRMIDDNYYEATGFPEKRKEGDVQEWAAAYEADKQIFTEKAQIFIRYFHHLWY